MAEFFWGEWGEVGRRQKIGLVSVVVVFLHESCGARAETRMATEQTSVCVFSRSRTHTSCAETVLCYARAQQRK